MPDLDTPAVVQTRPQEIDTDLAVRQLEFEEASLNHWRSKREKEKARADAFLRAEGTVAERTAKAEQQTALIGMEEEGRWEALKGVVRVLDTRAAIGMSILRSQGRA
jgi:hypothetical protein